VRWPRRRNYWNSCSTTKRYAEQGWHPEAIKLMTLLVLPPRDGAFQELLDRGDAAELVTKHFSEEMQSLSHAVDYGTRLLARSIHSSPKETREFVALAVLFKHALSHLDGVHSLLAVGAVSASWLPLRALFEVTINLDWLLDFQSAKRARAFYVWNLRRQRRFLERAVPGTEAALALIEETSALMKSDRLSDPATQQQLTNRIAEITKHLADPVFKSLDDDFTRLSKGKSYDVSWYVPCFPLKPRPSLRTLASDVKRLAEYRFIYETGSEAMHSSRSDTAVLLGGGMGTHLPLRDLTDLGLVTSLALGQASRTFLTVIQHFRPGEEGDFRRNYIEHWQKALMHPAKAEYQYVAPPVIL